MENSLIRTVIAGQLVPTVLLFGSCGAEIPKPVQTEETSSVSIRSSASRAVTTTGTSTVITTGLLEQTTTTASAALTDSSTTKASVTAAPTTTTTTTIPPTPKSKYRFYTKGNIGKLYRSLPDGSGETCLVNAQCAYVQQVGTEVYYFDMAQKVLHRMDENGQERDSYTLGRLLPYFMGRILPGMIRVEGSAVYFLQDGGDSGIFSGKVNFCRMNLDTKQKTVLYSQEVSFDGPSEVIVATTGEGAFYYIQNSQYSSEECTASIYAVSFRDGTRTLLTSARRPVGLDNSLYADGGYVYYNEMEKVGGETVCHISCVNVSTRVTRRVVTKAVSFELRSGDWVSLAVKDGMVYYAPYSLNTPMTPNGGIYRAPADGSGTPICLMQKMGREFSVSEDGKWVYWVSETQKKLDDGSGFSHLVEVTTEWNRMAVDGTNPVVLSTDSEICLAGKLYDW